MKYGESLFDILYLLFAILSGIWILRARRGSLGRIMGSAALILGIGDAFHLVPRVMNYFIDADFTAALGAGKLVTSVTMTVFYVLMDAIWQKLYQRERRLGITLCVYALAAIRILLCMMPQNRWMTNDGPGTWGIIRNAPFLLLGIVIIALYYRTRGEVRSFRRVWLYVALSFAFYIPVAVGAGAVPMLGMLMLPKTICYVLIIVCFLKYAGADRES